MTDDVLHHDDGTVDDHSEVQCAEREQVSGDVAEVEADGGKQQRERNRQRDDESASDVSQKEEENDDDEDDAFGEVMQHRVGGVVEKVAAVQEGDKLYTRRKDARIEFVDLFVNPCQSKLGVVALLQSYDSFDDIADHR